MGLGFGMGGGGVGAGAACKTDLSTQIADLDLRYSVPGLPLRVSSEGLRTSEEAGMGTTELLLATNTT